LYYNETAQQAVLFGVKFNTTAEMLKNNGGIYSVAYPFANRLF
jgi:hypothetical protein